MEDGSSTPRWSIRFSGETSMSSTSGDNEGWGGIRKGGQLATVPIPLATTYRRPHGAHRFVRLWDRVFLEGYVLRIGDVT